MNEPLITEIDKRFDPSDTDGCMQLAYEVAKLLTVCDRIRKADSLGVRIGRDDRSHLIVAMQDVGKALGLLTWNSSAEDVRQFHQLLGTIKGAPDDESSKS
jgi:hypothetical protein